MLNAGDIISRLRLDKTLFDKGMKQAYTTSRNTMDRLAKQTRTATRGMSRDMETFGKRSSATSRMFGKDWWRAFGQVAIGFTIAYRAMNAIEEGLKKLINVFVSGRQVIDDFRMAVVETAAAMQMLTEQPTTEGLEIYYAFAKDIFEKLEILAARHISTGEDLRIAYAKFAIMGIIPQTDKQLEQMAQIVDLTIMQTRGLNRQMQIRTEIQALVTGQQRRGAEVARMLKQRVDGYLELIGLMDKEVYVAKRTEMLFGGISKVLDAVGSVSEGILKTHLAWWATMTAILNRIQRAGLTQLYEDLLNVMKGIKKALLDQNGLTTLAITLAKGLHTAWAVVWNVLKPVASILMQIVWLGNKLFQITGVLKILAGTLVVIFAGWEKLGYLLQGNLEAVGRAHESMIKALDDIFMTQEQFRKKFMQQMKIDQAEIKKYLAEQKTGAEKASEAVAKSLAKWTKDIGKLKDEYIILGSVIRSFTEATYDPKAFKSMEWLWKTAKEWERIPFPELKQEYMKLKIAMSELNKELEKMQAAFELRKQIDDLETIYKITRQLISEVEKGKLKPADLARRRDELTIEAEYAALAAKTNAVLAARYILLTKEGIHQAQLLDDLIEKEKLYAEALEDTMEAHIDLQAEVDKGLRMTMESLDDLADKWMDVARTAAEVALASLTEISTLWELGLIDVEAFERAIDKIVEKYKDATKEMEEKSTEFAEVTKAALSDILVDAMMGRLDDFASYWEAFCEGMARIFADKLVVMLETWIKTQAEMKAIELAGTGAVKGAGGLLAAAGPVLGGLAALYAVVSITKGRAAKKEAQRREEQRRAELLANTWRDVYDQVLKLIYPLDAVTEEMNRVEKQFDDWRQTLIEVGATTNDLNRLEEQRAAALAKTREALRREFAEPLEDMIARMTLAPREYELYELKNWYDTQIDAARALGRESVALLQKAYEISKMQYILKQKELLLSQEAEFGKIVARIGMTPMELQLAAIEDWRESIHEVWEPIQAEIDALPGIIADYESEMARLRKLREDSLAGKLEADIAWEDAARTMLDQILLLPERTIIGLLGAIPTLEEMIEGIALPVGAGIGEPFAGWVREYNAAHAEYIAIIQSLTPILESIPGEIEDIEQAIIDKNKEIDELINSLTEAGAAEAAAYLAQIQAVANEFIGGLLSIIRSHTWSEYEQGLYDLNQWYADQVKVMEALGIQTDLLTQAYDLQRQALLETALDQSDLTDELDEWRSVLVRLRDQILSIQTSLANPLDILERMAILEGELTRVLGESWRAGIISTEGMSAEMVERMSGLLGQYLDMAADAFQRPSIEYQSIYGSVLDALMQLEEYAEETVTDLEIQLEQLEAQLRMVQLLEDMANGNSLPSLQGGIDYVPRTGPYLLHEGERVTSTGEGMAISITVNESATPQATGMAVKDEFIRLLRTDIGRKEIQQASRGR